MAGMFTQIGVPLSLYSGKTRAYLLHKRIPFVERGSNLWEYGITIPRRTKAAAVPVVITPEGEYLQDTSVIIDRLEARFPQNPVLPATPILRFSAYLFELWGDEFWLPLAMHTRWSHPENRPLFIHDAGDALLSGMPRWLKNLIGAKHARLMKSYADGLLGINDETRPLLDRFLQIHLDALDAHFADHPFLFGTCPSLGDFGLIGPLYAHIGRDPWSRRELIVPRRHLAAWIERMYQPDSSLNGRFFSEDRLPDSLTVALRSIFDEMVPFLAGCIQEIRKSPALPAGSRRVPRTFNEISHPLAGGVYRRLALSYPVWMTQRLLGVFAALSPDDQASLRTWLQSVGGEGVLRLDPPAVERVGLAAARL